MPRAPSCDGSCGGTCSKCKSRSYAAASRARAAAAPTGTTRTPTTCRKHPERPALPGRRQCKECRSRALGRVPRTELSAPRERSCVDCGAPCGFYPRCEPCYRARSEPRTPATSSVTWNADLTALRKALPAGTGIGLSARGVVIDMVGDGRKTFPDLTAALDWATTPNAL